MINTLRGLTYRNIGKVVNKFFNVPRKPLTYTYLTTDCVICLMCIFLYPIKVVIPVHIDHMCY